MSNVENHGYAWWRHQMETFSALLALCAGNSPVTGEFPSQRPVARSFDISFDLHLNKQLSKQWWDWWFESPSRSLWHHCHHLLSTGRTHAGRWAGLLVYKCSTVSAPPICPADGIYWQFSTVCLQWTRNVILLLTHLRLDKMAAILADDIFKSIFLNENDRIPIQISLKFVVPRGPIDNKPALVHVMAWRRTGDKPLPEPMLTPFSDAYLLHKRGMS